MPAIISTGNQRAGKISRVLVNSLPLTFASWEANALGADLSTVNFESYNIPRAETFGEGIMGVLSCEAKFGGAWDAGGAGSPMSARPTVNPPGLFPRDDLPAVQFLTSRLDGTVWLFPYMRVRGVTNSAAVEELVLFNVTDAKNQGRFDYP